MCLWSQHVQLQGFQVQLISNLVSATFPLADQLWGPSLPSTTRCFAPGRSSSSWWFFHPPQPLWKKVYIYSSIHIYLYIHIYVYIQYIRIHSCSLYKYIINMIMHILLPISKKKSRKNDAPFHEVKIKDLLRFHHLILHCKKKHGSWFVIFLSSNLLENPVEN